MHSSKKRESQSPAIKKGTKRMQSASRNYYNPPAQLYYTAEVCKTSSSVDVKMPKDAARSVDKAIHLVIGCFEVLIEKLSDIKGCHKYQLLSLIEHLRKRRYFAFSVDLQMLDLEYLPKAEQLMTEISREVSSIS